MEYDLRDVMMKSSCVRSWQCQIHSQGSPASKLNFLEDDFRPTFSPPFPHISFSSFTFPVVSYTGFSFYIFSGFLAIFILLLSTNISWQQDRATGGRLFRDDWANRQSSIEIDKQKCSFKNKIDKQV